MEITNLIKKNNNNKRGIRLINILFILLLIMGSVVVGYAFGKGQDKDVGDILGEKKQTALRKTKENNSNSSSGSVLGSMTTGVEKTLQDSIKRLTSIITDTASKSAENVTDAFFDSTVGTVLKQINKLPEKQQEDIRRNICK